MLLGKFSHTQSKCYIGISPSGKKMGHWDLSQSHVQDVSGIDPNVKKRGFWDQSQCHAQAVIGINPNEKQDYGISPNVLHMR